MNQLRRTTSVIAFPDAELKRAVLTKSALALLADVDRSQATRILAGKRPWNSEAGRKLFVALLATEEFSEDHLAPYRVASRIAHHRLWQQPTPTGETPRSRADHLWTFELEQVVRWAVALDNGRSDHPMPLGVIILLNEVINPVEAPKRVEAFEMTRSLELTLTGSVAAMLFGHAQLTIGRHEFAADSFERATRLLDRAAQLAPSKLEDAWKPWHETTSRTYDEFRLWSRHMWAVALRPSETPEVLGRALDLLIEATNDAMSRSSMPCLERGNALRGIASALASSDPADPHIEQYLNHAIGDITASGDEMMLAVTYSTRAVYRAGQGKGVEAAADIASALALLPAAHGVVRLAILNDVAQVLLDSEPERAKSYAEFAQAEALAGGYDD